MFELPQSGLKVDVNELLHYGEDKETLIASHPLDQITEIELYKSWNFHSIFISFVLVYGLSITGNYIESPVFLWIVRGILVFFLFITFLTLDKIILRIRFDRDEILFNLEDPWDKCASFTMALRRKWQEVLKESQGGYD